MHTIYSNKQRHIQSRTHTCKPIQTHTLANIHTHTDTRILTSLAETRSYLRARYAGVIGKCDSLKVATEKQGGN